MKVRLLIIGITVFMMTMTILLYKYCFHICLDIYNKEFYQHIVSEISGIGLSVLLIEIFANKLIIKSEISDYINIYEFNLKRLELINTRVRQSLILLCIDYNTKIESENEFKRIVDLVELNKLESRGHFINNKLQAINYQKPILFHLESKQLLNEITALSNSFPKYMPTKLYESVIKLTSHDTYLWDILGIPSTIYNDAWIEMNKIILFDYYKGYLLLNEGIFELKKLINKNKK